MKNYIYLLTSILLLAIACDKAQHMRSIQQDIINSKKALLGNYTELLPNKDLLKLSITDKELKLSSNDLKYLEILPYQLKDKETFLTERMLNGRLVKTEHSFSLYDEEERLLKINQLIPGKEAYPGEYEGDVRHFTSILFKKLD